MFGYVKPLKCELKVKELTLYEAWYCGLCKSIGRRYGQLPRCVLNYDCTFLALLLGGIYGAVPCKEEHCRYKSLRKKRPVAQDSIALQYAADINVLLAWHQCDDDWRDEQKPLALAGKTGFGSAAKKATMAQPQVAETIKSGLAVLSELERQQTDSIDEVANAFALILSDIFQQAPDLDQSESKVLGWLGYHLGRWIYLSDAWADRTKDKQTGNYNIWNMTQAEKERVSALLFMALSEIEKAYDLLTIKANKGVLDNIIRLGCRHQTEELLSGT